MDPPLWALARELARKEKQIKEFKRRMRFQGTLIEKAVTKKGNLLLKLRKGEETATFLILQSHKERYALAQQLLLGAALSAAGIPRFRALICTQLKRIKAVDESRQTLLG